MESKRKEKFLVSLSTKKTMGAITIAIAITITIAEHREL